MATEQGATPSDETAERHLRQGDLVALEAIPVVRSAGSTDWTATSEGAVVVSQTCDLLRRDNLEVVVARAVELDPVTAKEARQGRRPRYVNLPGIGQESFADLELIGTVSKSHPALRRARCGLTTDHQSRVFGQAVGRRFSRFPFPDEVVPWLEPLQRLAQNKAGKELSAEGWAFDHIVEIRVESSNGWKEPPYSVSLAFLVEPGELPVFPGDEPPNLSSNLEDLIRPGGSLSSPSHLAQLLKDEQEPESRYWLWPALVEGWGLQCRPDIKRLQKRYGKTFVEAVQDAIVGSEIPTDVLSTDEYTLSRYRRSEHLDLDHLSSPLPL